MSFEGETGTSLGGWGEKSSSRQMRERKKREREEKRWGKQNGPVTSRQMTPEERRQHGLPPCGDESESGVMVEGPKELPTGSG